MLEKSSNEGNRSNTDFHALTLIVLFVPSCHLRRKVFHPHRDSSVISDIVRQPSYPLLEDLSISPLVGLAFDLDWLVPRPLVLQVLLVLWLAWVELGELVALIVGSDIESWEGLIAADHEGAFDDRVAGYAVNRGCAEDVLPGCFETREEATYIGQLGQAK